MSKAFSLMALILTFMLTSSRAQQQPPRLQIIGNVVQNTKKISNFEVRTVRVKIYDKTTLATADVANSVDREVFTVDGSNAFIETESSRVLLEDTLQRRIRYWQSQGGAKNFVAVDKDQYLENGVKKDFIVDAYENSDRPKPWGSLTDLQIYVPGMGVNIPGVPSAQLDSSIYLMASSYTGKENYRGLECLKMVWNDPKNEASSGYALICPERNWKIVYSEIVEPDSDGKGDETRTDVYAVENFIHSEDVWLPSVVYHQRKYQNPNKERISFKEKLKVVEFIPNYVNSSSIFEPIFSPGTHLFNANEEGSEAKIIGGDISFLIRQLQKGDYSLVEPEVKDLSKP